MTLLALIRTELARLTATPMARLAFVALMIVPLMYGGAYLWANQDPYARLHNIPAAIVNSDLGSTNTDGQSVNYGKDVQDRAVSGNTFAWHTASTRTAAAGVRSGRYDFVVTIPSSFSSDLTSASTEKPRQAKIILTTADTNSYLASTIAEQAGKTLRQAVQQQVGREAAKTLLVGLSDIRDQLGSAVSGADKLAAGATTAQRGSSTLKDGSAAVSDGASELAAKTRRLPAQANELNDGAQQLATGASALGEGLQQLDRRSAQLPASTSALDDGAQQLATGLNTIDDGTAKLPEQTAALNTGAQQLAAGLNTIDDGTAKLPGQTAALNTGAQQLATGLTALSNQTTNLPTQTSALNDGAQQVAGGTTDLQQRLVPLVNASNLTAEQKSALISEIESVRAGSQTVADATGQIASTAPALTAGISQSAAGASQLANGTKTLSEAAPTLAAGVQKASSGATQLADGTGRLAKASPALASGISDASKGAQQLAGGTTALASAAPALTNGIQEAASGATRLDTGASQLAAGTKALAAAAPALQQGTAQLADGASQVDTGVGSLQNGLAKLTDGARELSSGLAKGQQQIPASDTASRNKQSAVISNPTDVTDDNIAAAGTYGAGLAPFFISLAAWIGMYALFLILKPLSKRAISALRGPISITLGGWLTPAILGVIQMIALYCIVRFALGFGVVHVAGTIAIMILASATFAAIILVLNVLLGSVGQFLGLVLMLLQLVTAGGTFPWQTLPPPLAALHHLLPMSYSVDALRQLMYGGSIATAWSDAAVLIGWLVAALTITALAAARQRRTRQLRDLRPSLIG
ncbi:YhgE/Pip domain-containing protein [Curtobacterium sp. A7_M15]|uniref:YhgE/Pip domain-containing protein n=1 Tax=Curtobacterium sp. A7_M15 TaxID=3065241 RepID=UPI0027379F2F|nr:YhgE/Pip domain-containing protein [Curtobacterium sp. A7_M15]MDP4331994.1 YhgE/Pip domain-containing protein [Curtobacterium sp. A7_M15]